MTTKDYTDPKTMQEIIEKCRSLQEEFNSEINLDYLEKALEILDKAIENTPEDDPSREKYIYERNRLYNRYPDVERWLSGPRCDYQLDIKYEYAYDNEEQEELHRYIIIKHKNNFNVKREKDSQAFIEKHREIFQNQFDYALVGFQGNRYEQMEYQTDHWQDWVSIFLSKQEYPKIFPCDESFEIFNAPPLDGDHIVYLPIKPNSSGDSGKKQGKGKDSFNNCFLLPLYKKDGAEDTDRPNALLEFSSILLNDIAKIGQLNDRHEVKDLDIKSFHFIGNKIYISEEMNDMYKQHAYYYKEWLFDNIALTGNKAIPKSDVQGLDLDDFLCFEGNRSQKSYVEISISREGYVKSNEVNVEGGFAKLRLLFNFSDLFFEDDVPEYVLEEWDPSEDLFDYEFWEDNPNEYEIFSDLPLGDFLALFPGFPDNNKSNN